ncbi:Mg-transporting ATPase [Suillus plorans]|uniref:Magnesium-transporting ATPase, P-type 1 n=1 Tax=Suillus plorans TaxID=116603 RepID=A0A9P7AJ22_9AGAM|nr:Mg-transporting ATPase [Suillus plorans]KAG1790502.1 Mg-transporting ATPase [Suillus plorans]
MPFLANLFSPRSLANLEKHGPDIATLDSESNKSPVPPQVVAKEEQEQLICATLSRFAQVPVSAIFVLEPEWNPTGLTDDQASEILKIHGPNTPVAERRLAALRMFWGAIVNPFNILLTILAIVNAATDQLPTFVVMMAMVVASTGLRYWQELKSTIQAVNLIKSVTTNTRVLRYRSSGPEEVEIDQRSVVPGDIIAVTSGDVFPGDCVLITAEAITITQASLTGEVMPIEKTVRLAAPRPGQTLNLLHNDNVCLAGTSVVTGNGHALVVSTGKDTYMASIASELSKRRPENATQIGIRKVSYVLMAFMGVMAPIVLIIQGAVSKNWKGAVMFAIAVAVGITPEMLPMIVTSNLALSAVRVARKKVIVKRFDAIQNLGAVQILCSDKTGTLTADLVRISMSTTGTGEPSQLPIKLAYINSSLQTGSRSPIDHAIVDFVDQSEQDIFTDIPGDGWIKQGEVPFDSSRRLLSVLVSRPGSDGSEGLLITKGAVDEVLDLCVSTYNHQPPSSNASGPFALSPSMTSILTTHERQTILDTAQRLNEDGLRLVAVACREQLIKPFMTISPSDENELTFIGFIGLLDPLKPDATQAIKDLAALNVQVRILTGDAPAVAAKVARDLGLIPSREQSSTTVNEKDVEASPSSNGDEGLILTGVQLAALADDQDAYQDAIDRCIIFAKLSPYQKLEVVKALRAGHGGRAVAFLGDGVNDALAIRGADVGISVDSGTEIAKEAADVILLEKNLAVVADGVMEGRITLMNTLKYIKMATSSNFGNIFSLLVASAWLPYQPMIPIQILVQNLLYDFSQASIPWDNVDPEYLVAPKTWGAKSIIRFMVCIGPFSSPFDIITFSINWFHYGIRTLHNPRVDLAQTNWFLEGSLTQLLIIHFLRTGKLPFIQSRASIAVFCTTFGIAGIAIAIPYIPKINTALQLTPPDPLFYAYLLGVIAGYALVVHIAKTLYQLAFKEWL